MKVDLGRTEITAATWNIQYLTFDKLEPVMEENYDMLALTELHDRPHEGWDLDIKYPGRVFCSDPSNSTDTAAGAAVLLSTRMAKRLISWQACGTRIVWVRIEGHTYNLIFIAVYVPHKYRTEPSQADTLQEIDTLCRTLRHKYPADQLIVAGDMNGRIPRNVKHISGKFSMHSYADSGGERLMEMMHNNHLHAASTRFCPPRSHACGQGTYLSPQGNLKQLDYILCSNEHAGTMMRCRVLWHLSMDAHGDRQDHGLICMQMRWRIRVHRQRESTRVNREALEDPVQANAFDGAFEKSMQDMTLTGTNCNLYSSMQTALQAAAKTLPTITNQKPPTRFISQATQDLVAERRRKCQSAEDTNTAHKKRQIKSEYRKAIGRSRLGDYRAHVARQIDQVVDAAENRDDKGFWRASYRIAGKGKATTRAQPPADSDESRAEAWAVYAEELFSASTREAARPRIKLSPATARLGDKNNVPVSEKVRAHLEHLRKNRAAGPSGLPVEAYLSSPAATQVLITVIQRCFEEECLPEDLPHSSFISIFKSGDTTDRAKYRLLALQEVAAKLLSSLLLERIAYEVGEAPEARARERVTAPSMIEVQNFEFAGNLSSQSPSSPNGPINQTNSTGKSLNGHSTGKSLKLNPDAEVFTNPRTRQKEKNLWLSVKTTVKTPEVKTPEISTVKTPQISSRKSHFPKTPQINHTCRSHKLDSEKADRYAITHSHCGH